MGSEENLMVAPSHIYPWPHIREFLSPQVSNGTSHPPTYPKCSLQATASQLKVAG